MKPGGTYHFQRKFHPGQQKEVIGCVVTKLSLTVAARSWNCSKSGKLSLKPVLPLAFAAWARVGTQVTCSAQHGYSSLFCFFHYAASKELRKGPQPQASAKASPRSRCTLAVFI